MKAKSVSASGEALLRVLGSRRVCTRTRARTLFLLVADAATRARSARSSRRRLTRFGASLRTSGRKSATEASTQGAASGPRATAARSVRRLFTIPKNKAPPTHCWFLDDVLLAKKNNALASVSPESTARQRRPKTSR
jgi:hypothetical protein